MVSYLAGTYFGGAMMVDRDLSAAVFGALHKRFFGQGGEPIEYHLRAKNNAQDDPFDEYVRESLNGDLGPDIRTVSSGPVTSPDMVIWRPSVMGAFTGDGASSDLVRIFGMEVKKLERGSKGRVARGSGMDYNSTPPCGTIRAYDENKEAVDIRGFYLFVVQEAAIGRADYYRLTTLCLCDGNFLNEDFDYYLSVTGLRLKKLGVGSYGDGFDRQRPMLVFPNPLGIDLLDRRATLVHLRSDLETEYPGLRKVGTFRRTLRVNPNLAADSEPEYRRFYCYRLSSDDADGCEFDELDPLPPTKHSETTSPRGLFVIEGLDSRHPQQLL